MPNPLSSVGIPTQDTYVDALTLGPSAHIKYVAFTVNNANVLLQVSKLGRNMKPYWDLEEALFNPGQWSYEDICGIRFRSAVPGVVAVVTATAYFWNDVIPDGTGVGPSTAVSFNIVAHGKRNGTSGVATQVQQNVLCAGVVVRAKPGNVGLVYLGNSGVNNSNGYDMSPGDALGLAIGNANRIFFDVQNTGDGISWVAVG